MSESGRMVVPDDPSVENDHGLIRHASLDKCRPVRRDDGTYRVPSNAFHLRSKMNELYLSVDLEALLVRDGLLPTQYLKEGEYAARLVAGTARELGLGLTPEPLEDNPHHGGIWGLDRLPNNARDRAMRELAKRSDLIFRASSAG